MREVVIVGAARTPTGSFHGCLASVAATRLGSIAIAEAVKRAGIRPEQVDEVIMGNVVSAGLGQAPARQAAIGAGLPVSTGAVTVNKVCGSGLKAVMLAYQAIVTGEAEIVVAGGMESMSRAPYLLDRARGGYRLGHGELLDSVILDGLWDPYHGFPMGMCGEICAEKYQISREAQDAYAAQSYDRALQAQGEGKFRAEIVPVELSDRRGNLTVVAEDEEPKRGDPAKFGRLKPAFKEGGTVTAANAPSLNDGAAALVVMPGERAQDLGLRPMARILGQATASLAPEWFTIAPADAVKKLLKKLDLTAEEIDLYEINEAFSVVALVVMRLLGLPDRRVNVNGGCVALGHPIGASGARILTTLLYAMAARDAGRGVAAICLGGGEAVAMAVERV